MAFFVIPKATLTREMKFKEISIIESISALGTGLLTLTLAWLGYGVWSLVIGALFGIVVRTIGMNIVDPFLTWPSFNFGGFAEAAKFGGYISLNRILWYLYSKADVMIIGKILGKTDLGYYSVAMNLASLPLEKVGSIINQIGLPAYAKLQDNREQVASYAAKASRIISFVAFPVFFGISCVAPELVRLALGEKWLSAIFPLQLLALIVPLKSLSLSLSPAVNGLGRPDINVKVMAAASIIIPISILVGVKWGLVGVSIAWVISYSVWFIYMLTQSLPVLGLTLPRFIKTLTRPLFVGIAMFAVVYAVRWVLSGHDLGVVLPFILFSAHPDRAFS
jgi:teichuronic acid exporter